MATWSRRGCPTHPDGSGADPAPRDPAAKFYVICHVGGRSMRVAQYLQRNGFQPVNVDGGMLAWANAGRPVITDGGGPGGV